MELPGRPDSIQGRAVQRTGIGKLFATPCPADPQVLHAHSLSVMNSLSLCHLPNRYKLLFNDLIKHTAPHHPDYPTLRGAFSSIQEGRSVSSLVQRRV